MKTFSYVAAIALLAAGTAFAQSNTTINNSTNTPSASGPADSAGTMSNQHLQSITPKAGSKSSGSMNQSGSTMNQSSGMDRSMDNTHASIKGKSKSRHMASTSARRGGGNDSKENQETMQLNRQQLAGSGASNAGRSTNGMSSSGAGNPFDNGSPQQAQAGGPNCSPDNASCGTARQNPAINSSPQHRTYGNQQ